MRHGMWIGLPWGRGASGATPQPPDPPEPGPLDYIEDGEDLDEIRVEYELARDVALGGVAFRHSGALTGVTVTHGGEPLEVTGFVLDDQTNIGCATFLGHGLTIEPADLVITPIGGLIGPAVMRIDDSFLIDDPVVGIVGERQGASYVGAATQPVAVPFQPVTGAGWGLWALACASAEKSSGVRSWGAGQVSTLFEGVASSGTLQHAPDWASAGPGWVENGEWWEHTGPASYLTGDPLSEQMPNPFWYEVEVDVDEGGRLYIHTIGSNGLHLSHTVIGPYSDVIRVYRSQNYMATGFRMQGLNGARFRNFQYCRDGQTVYGSFGRTVNQVPDGSSLQFSIGALSRYAGVIMEVHEAPAIPGFTMTAAQSGNLVGYSNGVAVAPFGSLSRLDTGVAAWYYDPNTSAIYVFLAGDRVSELSGKSMVVNGVVKSQYDVVFGGGWTRLMYMPQNPIVSGQTCSIAFQ